MRMWMPSQQLDQHPTGRAPPLCRQLHHRLAQQDSLAEPHRSRGAAFAQFHHMLVWRRRQHEVDLIKTTNISAKDNDAYR